MTQAQSRVVGYLSAAAMAGCAIISAGCGPASSGQNGSPPVGSTPDVACDGHQGANRSAPQIYRSRYSDTVVQPLHRILAVCHAAIEANHTQQIGDAASALFGQIRSDIDTFGRQSTFGCYQPELLAHLRSATDAFAQTLADIVDAAASGDGRTPAEIPTLITQATLREKAYIAALNTYARPVRRRPAISALTVRPNNPPLRCGLDHRDRHTSRADNPPRSV